MIFPRLAEELAWLRAALSQEAKDEPKADKAIGAVGTAENVAKQMELACYGISEPLVSGHIWVPRRLAHWLGCGRASNMPNLGRQNGGDLYGMKFPTRRSMLIMMSIIISGYSAAANEAMDPHVKEIGEKMKQLYDDMMIFKSNEKFHTMGFGSNSPYRAWFDNVMLLDKESSGMKLAQSGFRTFPMDLYTMAIDYRKSSGNETQYTKQIRKDFQSTFERVASGVGRQSAW